ncbi:ATP-dependent helicase [Cellvibrio zantedeschiae]|uniref:ATP-dependent helicase n=1 Tax=Cellvibrio zantedeschiae TaxID=1237077 RepID=A0ABQ3AS81_9GAMM|nr:ATP-dependent helicase HrpB [Cellvibrio zantedeschiae]GGY65217.1 ATP-dependent helicase [Cellvibrio zantedeschiae]
MSQDFTSKNFLNNLPQYPLTELRNDFFRALHKGTLLLEAEPGAGKSTLAPLWMLHQLAAKQKIILVQPRVLAVQSLAQRLAELVGDEVGQTVAYQVPYDNCVGDSSRLIVMTPGILLQHLLQDPTLENIACVMLDEIHERSVNQDTAWAWLQEVQILREDLRIILMSATPDPQLQQQMPQRLFAPGRCFPVSTQYLPAKNNTPYPERVEDHVLRALVSHPEWQAATTLVFLAGWSEIEKCTQAIQARYPNQAIFRLHSRVPNVEQKRALNPASGPRIILATNIAETSLTIADVTLVIDSGQVRRPDYEQRTGLTRLRLSRISQASADQRRGRAGRVQQGHCIRLWSQDQPLAAADLPEIRATDYLPLALRLAHWGSPALSLPWLESPNKLALDFAQQQLRQMKLLDADNKITPAGEQVSALGTHPRIAAFLLAQEKSIAEAEMLLALALHFDLSCETDIDDLLQLAAQELQRNRQWQHQQKRWLQKLQLTIVSADKLQVNNLARAFSDRIGYQQDSGRFRLNSGISVEPQAKLDSQWAVFPIINSKPKGHSGIGIALQLSADEQRSLSQQQSRLIHKGSMWQLHNEWRMGGVVIGEEFVALAAEQIPKLLLNLIQEKIAEKGLMQLSWSANAERLLQRARFVQSQSLLDLPNLNDEALTATLDIWLLPFLTAQTTLDQLPWLNALEFYLGYENCQAIAQALPEKIELPSGRHVVVEFSAEGVPQVSAKLQEFFGCEQLQLAGGKLPLKIHLLSPNGSPLAITMNLQTFWRQAYPEVRKEMRGKYPRHPWPENPLEHEATALTKRKLALQQK